MPRNCQSKIQGGLEDIQNGDDLNSREARRGVITQYMARLEVACRTASADSAERQHALQVTGSPVLLGDLLTV
jgi:hypothetical protein